MAELISFPIIPSAMLDVAGMIEPCPEVREWARAMFVDPDGPLVNLSHEHLRDAWIEFLWTNVEFTEFDGTQRILGMAQLGRASGKAWAKAQRQEQLHRWFRGEPDFLIILDVVNLSTAQPEAICALVEHELMHCSFKKDEFGDPKLDKYGEYQWAMHGHDVEQFIDVMARYGPTSDAEEKFVEAAKHGPQFKRIELAGICGSCVK